MSPAHTSETIENEKPALPAPAPQLALPEPAKGGGLKKFLIALILLAAIGGAWWKIQQNNAETKLAANKEDRAKGGAAIPVTAAAVQVKTMPIYLTALGTVTAYNSVTVKTRVDGQLLTVAVREGQAVRKGQLLAQIDPAPYAAAVAQAEGQLAKDQASADYANVESKRYQDLYAAGVVSKDSAQTQASSAGQISGAIMADKAAIQAAKVNLAYTHITSPIDGVVGLRQVDPGNIVHASDTTGLLIVNQLHPISVIFTLPEDQLPEVQKAMGQRKLVAKAFDRSQTTHLADGTVLTLDNSIDTTTGTDKVKAVFDNTENTLFPNQFVNIQLILQNRPNSIVIPAAALSTGTQGNFVYVVKEGTPPADPDKPKKTKAVDAAPAADGAEAPPAAKGPSYYVEVRPVVVDLTEGTNVILKSGLEAGEQVVTDGQEKLKNHSKVSPKVSKKSEAGPKEAQANPDAPSSPDAAAGHKGHKKGQ
ncbi:membrane fusion protein, multidrug efflux system [Granulicella rosea]|uniref:Membrane fusion protein, multidrug efflux system n=2 Tax=Granulicella rosea TaxID=474952 RepID=A0A239KP81_9BACT|nr:membrane fusion protein, multidrug efflux system [Granulicella rosea]